MSDIPETPRRSRRDALVVGGIAAFGAAAGALVRPDQALAGTDGDVVLGGTNLMADKAATQIIGNPTNFAAFVVTNTGTGSGISAHAEAVTGQTGIQGVAVDGIGVSGTDNNTGTGVEGFGGTGVHGIGTLGVLAEASSIGVKALVTGGTLTQGTALVASTAGDPGSALGGRYGLYALGGTPEYSPKASIRPGLA